MDDSFVAETTRDFLSQPRDAFKAKQLSYVVGAGASVAAGLPRWTDLTINFLRLFLRTQAQTASLEPEELIAIAERFTEQLGLTAVVDYVREQTDQKKFVEMLRHALYGSTQNPVPHVIHYELAASLRHGARRIYTTNYDTLLQTAARKLGLDVPTAFGPAKLPEHCVAHLHGMLDNDSQGGDIILSEKDYLEGTGEWADRQLEDILNDPATSVLLVGFSMTDPRIRRLLFKRLQRKKRGKVYLLMSSDAPRSAEDLVSRRARQVVLGAEPAYWKAWDIKFLRADAHGSVPALLRRIRLGDDAYEWCRIAQDFLEKHQPRSADSQGDRQAQATSYLEHQEDFIRRRFRVRLDECLDLGFFAPCVTEDRSVRLELRYFHSSQKLSIGRLADYQLDVSSLASAQGAAGFSFLRGTSVEARKGSSQLDLNFTTEMRRSWNAQRAFSTLLCWPVHGSPEWVPIGVVCISSNEPAPFWSRLDAADRYLLEELLDSMFQVLMCKQPERTQP